MTLNTEKIDREPFLTIQELADRGSIPVGKTRLYEMAQAGVFRSYRVGRKVLVLESEVIKDIKTKCGMRVIRGVKT